MVARDETSRGGGDPTRAATCQQRHNLVTLVAAVGGNYHRVSP